MAIKLITPVMRASFVHIAEKAPLPNGSMAYSISLLIPKSDPGVDQIQKAIKDAYKEFFGNKAPKVWWNPLRDGDKEREEDCYEGHYFLSAKTDRPVGVVDRRAQPLMDIDELYSGCYVRASLNFYGFNHKESGKKGIGVGLRNLMKWDDGERLDGVVAAEKEFAEFADDSGESSDFLEE